MKKYLKQINQDLKSLLKFDCELFNIFMKKKLDIKKEQLLENKSTLPKM